MPASFPDLHDVFSVATLSAPRTEAPPSERRVSVRLGRVRAFVRASDGTVSNGFLREEEERGLPVLGHHWCAPRRAGQVWGASRARMVSDFPGGVGKSVHGTRVA
jgi:hypothetical protein